MPAYTSGSSFTLAAPTPTPYGDFVAPDPNATSKAMQFRAAEGQKAIERSAAARGTLLNGGTLKALEDFRQGLASTEYGNDFNRALSVYDTNRATNQQNFGQSLASFGGNLNAFGANTNAALDWGRLGLDSTLAGYDRGYQASRDAMADQRGNTAANMYAQEVERQRQDMLYQRQLEEDRRVTELRRQQQEREVEARRTPYRGARDYGRG